MSKEIRKCPHCGEIITEENLTVCPACAEDLPKEESESLKIVCPYCGEEIDKTSTFCPSCGEKIKNNNGSNNKNLKSENKNSMKIIGYIVKTVFTIILLIVSCVVGKSMYMNFMLFSLYGTTKLGLERLNEASTACTINDAIDAANGAYRIASNGLIKHGDKDMPYAIKGSAAFIQSTLYNDFDIKRIKNDHYYEEAIKLTDKALSINPNNFIALHTKAKNSYLMENDFEKALEYINKAIEQNPKYAKLYFTRATINMKRNVDYKIIMDDYDNAIKYGPKISIYYSTRALAKNMYAKDTDSMLEDANKAVELCNNSAIGYVDRCMIKDKIGDYKGALEDCDKAILLNVEGNSFMRNDSIQNTNKVIEIYKNTIKSKM